MLKSLDTTGWSRSDLLREARLQAEAIRRLETWLRIGYSLLAIGFILAYWGFYGNGGTASGVVGIVALVIGAAASVILRVGVSNGRRNVKSIVSAAGVDLDAVRDSRGR